MRTYADLFTGGGGASLGARAAGYQHVFGIENDPMIADVARMNGFNVLTADVCSVDYTAMPAVSWLHASPPCTNASQAKTDAGETALDGELAAAVCRAIRDIRPACFTLENVFGYRTFNAFAAILQALTEYGYSYEYWHLNSANYAVPQTRRRLILVAKLGTWRIQRPEPTHRDGGDMFLPPWVGWYEAIADLIPTLPESRFADWQLKRLPVLLESGLVRGANSQQEITPERQYRRVTEPAMTVRPAEMPRAFIVSANSIDGGVPAQRDGSEPVMTVTPNMNRTRAFIVDGMATDHGRTVTVPNGHEPMMTVTATGERRKIRAFLIDGANTSEDKAGPGVGVSEADEPTRCVNASNSSQWRAWLGQGRVVSMLPRCLARFMGVEDSYVLPAKNALACKILGNMCTPPLFKIIGESL